jgi:hypothetical protein
MQTGKTLEILIPQEGPGLSTCSKYWQEDARNLAKLMLNRNL